MSNVPALQITPNGVEVPQSVDIRAGVLADTNEAFGGDLDIVTPSTPQAYLADNLTQNIVDANAQVAYFVNQVDPANAEGRMQDAIARIYFLERKGATSSVVQAQLVGQSGVVMPAGQLAEDDSGNIWESDGEVTFPLGGGNATVQFSCRTTGPIQLGIGELTRIAQTFNGWDAITNLGPATVGSNVESRASFEARRKESIAKNGRGTPPAIRSAVWDVEGVLDVFAYDNFTNAVLPYGATNYNLAPHSIYIGVIGGDDEAVAQAIWSKLDAGCDMNGNTTVEIQDTDGYTYPYPSYDITFNRPTSLPIKFEVKIANSTSLPADVSDLVKAAVISVFNGESGSQRARMGGLIFASNYYAAVSQISNSISIIQIKAGTTTANLDSVPIGIDQAPTLQASDITVTIV